MNNNIKQKNKAFTLLEILLVVAAIAILASIVIVAINPQRQLAQFRDAQRQNDINQLNSALTQYIIDGNTLPTQISEIPQEICNTGSTPGTDEPVCDSALINLSFLVPAYISAIPNDPSVNISAFITPTYAQSITLSSGYTVATGEANRLVVQAPKSETQAVGVGEVSNSFSLEFSGDEDSVQISSFTPYDFPSWTYTISVWVKPSTLSGNQAIVDTYGSLRFYSSSGANGILKIQNRSAFASTGVLSPVNTLQNDSWSHVAAVVDGTNATLYHNGTEVASGSIDMYASSSYNLAIGGRPSDSSSGIASFDGKISNVKIYDQALSPQEIDNLYSKIHVTNGLVGWWNFNEEDANSIADLSGNGNDGVPTGVTWSPDTP